MTCMFSSPALIRATEGELSNISVSFQTTFGNCNVWHLLAFLIENLSTSLSGSLCSLCLKMVACS